jgi:hypothetical protein
VDAERCGAPEDDLNPVAGATVGWSHAASARKNGTMKELLGFR